LSGGLILKFRIVVFTEHGMQRLRILFFSLFVLTVVPLSGNDGTAPTRDSLDKPPTRGRFRTVTNAGFAFLNFSFGGYSPVPGRHFLLSTWLHAGVSRHILRADLYDDEAFPPTVPVMTLDDRIVAPMLYVGVKLQVYCFLLEVECELLHLQPDMLKLGLGWSI
jgi:hypothetical protein